MSAPSQTAPLRALELVHIAWFGFVAAIVALFAGRIPHAWPIAGANAAAALLFWWLGTRLVPRLGKRALTVRTVLTCIAVPVSFSQLGAIVPYLNPARYGAQLRQLDLDWFGFDAGQALWAVHYPLLTEFLQIVYASFYFLPLLLGALLIRKRELDRYEFMGTATVLGFYLSYIGYMVVPAVSPYHFVEYGGPLQGIWSFAPIRETLSALEAIKLDCFPSGHTEITALTMVLAWRFTPRWFWRFFLPWGSALIFATLYLRYHYLVDVFAGLLFVIPSVWGTRLLWRRQPPLSA